MASTHHVAGMTCGGCARSVEVAIKEAAPTVEAVTVNLEAGTVTVAGDAPDAVIETAVEDAGFVYGGRAA
ncbi:heavy-metal-associated domain-containing protein [Roseospira visakhapatnamensis]|uniref:Copper chaperone n=1 Tax=Roseospira visakhapatnamensis TaxID=390880 RepID=A0A7W6W8K7_9PROT|nr:heavy metal-associated domain-containing protein [Roseospira visakhapatnamensis]MBB4264979.1 copper chaperone [Roseospira visakhapatnamensis]